MILLCSLSTSAKNFTQTSATDHYEFVVRRQFQPYLRLQYEEQLLKNTCSCAIDFSLACHDYESWIDTQHPVFSFQSIEHVHGKSWLVFLSGRNFNKLKQILYWLSDLKQDISDKPTQSKVGSKVFNDWIYISQFYNKVTVDIRR